jgi:hypothetical protein
VAQYIGPEFKPQYHKKLYRLWRIRSKTEFLLETYAYNYKKEKKQSYYRNSKNLTSCHRILQ